MVMVDSYCVGAEVAEGGVASAGVIPALDVGEERAGGGPAGGPGSAVDEFGFHGREERLGDRVVGPVLV
jgi:hypothetical protein